MRLSDSEWTVMNALWRFPEPATTREIHTEVTEATDWAYTTVKTLLDRLVDKAAVRADRSGNVVHYSPSIPRESARRSALQSLVERAFGGTFGDLVHHMVEHEKLSLAERRRIAELLRDLEDVQPRRKGRQS